MRHLIHKLRNFILKLRLRYFRMLGMDIDLSARISLKARLDKTYPKGIHIGKESYIGGMF